MRRVIAVLPGRFFRGLAMLLAVLALLAAQAISPADAPVRQSSSSTDQSANASGENGLPAGGVGYKFLPGQQLFYQIRYDSSAQADFRPLMKDDTPGRKPGAQAPQSSGLVYSLHAELIAALTGIPVRVTPQSVEMLYKLNPSSLHVVVNGQRQTAAESQMAADLTHGILVEMSPQGRVLAVISDPEVGQISLDLFRTLLIGMEFILPEGPAGESLWRAQEESLSGPYIAEYSASREPESSKTDGEFAPVKIRKTKLRFLPLAAAGGPSSSSAQPGVRKVIHPKGSMVASFDSVNGRLTRVYGTEIEDTEVQGKHVAHSVTNLAVALQKVRPISSEALSLLEQAANALQQNGKRLALFVPVSASEMERNIQKSTLGNTSAESILRQLSALKESPDADETSLYLKVKALAYLHPETCERMGKILAQTSASAPLYHMLARALEAVGSPEAQAALAEVVSARSTEWAVAGSIVPALASVPHPTLQAENLLRSLAQNSDDPRVVSAAVLGLGAMAFHLAETEPGRADAILDGLLRRLSTAQKENETIDVLGALGNSASPRALPALMRFASDKSALIRAAAFSGLRRMQSPKVDPILLSALESDPDPYARLEAAASLGHRAPSDDSFSVQVRAFDSEKDARIRVVLLRNLARNYSQKPGVQELLAKAEASDSSDYVRNTAKQLLKRLGARGIPGGMAEGKGAVPKP